MENTLDNISRPLVRVPEVTLYFWIIKVMATTVGETAADFLAVTLNLGLVLTSGVMGSFLFIALINQFRLKRYIPANYWLVVVLVSIVGTLITDLLVDKLGVSLITATTGFSIALAAVFVAWYLSEKNLAMHSIRTAKREIFYWTTILFTFALGTAAGDLLAEASGLGYWQSALVFGAAIAFIAAGYYFLGIDEILAFWLIYILTRPLGASTGDWLSQPVKNGGLGFGTVGTSMIFLTTILILIGYLSLTRKDQFRSNETTADD